MPTLPCSSGTLSFVEAGAGPGVVMLHSIGSSSAQWAGVTAWLRRSHRVLALDFHNCGGTSRWRGGAQGLVEAEVELARLVIDFAGERRIHVIGHSYGGWIALHLARLVPARIASLVLIEPVALHLLGEFDPVGYSEYLRESDAYVDLVRRGEPARAAERFVDYWNWPGTWQMMPAEFRDTMVALADHFCDVYAVGPIEKLTLAEIANIALPTLVVCGEASPQPTRSLAHRLAEVIPGAALTTIPGAGHMSPVTHAREVSRRLLEYIAAHAAREEKVTA